MVDTVEPFVHRLEAGVNRDKPAVNRNKPGVDRGKPGVNRGKTGIDSLEAFILRGKTRVHFSKASVNQLRMLAKVFFEGFIAHGSFEKCDSLVE